MKSFGFLNLVWECYISRILEFSDMNNYLFAATAAVTQTKTMPAGDLLGSCSLSATNMRVPPTRAYDPQN